MKKLLFIIIVSFMFVSCERETGSEVGDVIFIHSSFGGYKTSRGPVEKTAYDKKTKEKDVTFAFSTELKAYLEKRGYEVILTESDDNMLTYDEVKNQAHGKNIKALLQINTGWSIDERRDKISGIRIFYSKKLPLNRQLDSLISRSMSVHSNIMARNLGMHSAAVLNLPDIPGIRIELGNINNKDDLAKMLDGKYRQSIIEAISYALDEFISSYN
ncbi:MAG TPA: N-acetylmuramoyl-L-alanine amidase [Ignavibacteriales bacterium]|nr:N-acetylmuramoyl-L-alanine amidase [Ignavibacteriales bacterium]